MSSGVAVVASVAVVIVRAMSCGGAECIGVEVVVAYVVVDVAVVLCN